jgi:prepilin-type N-terminal cleavage/methylation domain-containing protein
MKHPATPSGPNPTANRRPVRRPRQRGFTLIEASLVTLIVGIGGLAITSAQQAWHQQNRYALNMGTALFLANEAREMTLGLPRLDPISSNLNWGPEDNELDEQGYDDLDDFDGADGQGVVFDPPLDAMRQVIPDMGGWSQEITVQSIDPLDISGVALDDGASEMVRMTCRILYQGPMDNAPTEITRLTWARSGGL